MVNQTDKLSNKRTQMLFTPESREEKTLEQALRNDIGPYRLVNI